MEENEVKVVREEKKVKTSSAVWLGVANASTGLLVAFAEGSAITYFFHNFLGLNEWISGLIWILFGIWNAINDPIYGFLADRTKSKLGRRIPWIRYGAPIMAVLFAVCWIYFPQMRGVQWFLGIQMALSLFLFDIVYTAIASAIYVMPYEMAVTNKARSPIFVWNLVFSLISFGAPIVLNTFLNVLIEKYQNIFPFVMAAVGLIMGGFVFVSTFFYKESGYHRDEPQPRFFEGLKQCLKNKSFLLFEVLSWTVIFAQNALMLGLTYMQSMWAVNQPYAQANGWLGGTSVIILYAALFVGALGAIFFYIFTREKFGNRILTLVMCGCMGAGCFLGSFLGQYFWALVFSFVLIGIGFSGGLYLVPLVNGDVIDKDEVDNGSRREGVYAGINSLITKPAGALAQAIFPVMLGWFGFNPDIKTAVLNGDGTPQANPFYQEGSSIEAFANPFNMQTDWAAQPESARNGMFICWLLLTGILLGLSFLAMRFYPLYGKEWNDVKAKLATEHLRKEEEYEQAALAELEKQGK